MSDEERAEGERLVSAGNHCAASVAGTVYSWLSQAAGNDPRRRLLWCAGFLAHVFGGFALMLGPDAARVLFRDIADKPTPMDKA